MQSFTHLLKNFGELEVLIYRCSYEISNRYSKTKLGGNNEIN